LNRRGWILGTHAEIHQYNQVDFQSLGVAEFDFAREDSW